MIRSRWIRAVVSPARSLNGQWIYFSDASIRGKKAKREEDSVQPIQIFTNGPIVIIGKKWAVSAYQQIIIGQKAKYWLNRCADIILVLK